MALSARAEIAKAMVAADTRLIEVVKRHGPPPARKATAVPDRFAMLARAIIFQQLAGKAASTIHGRIADACGGPLSAKSILRLGDEGLRSNGASRQKALALLDLASHEQDGSLDFSRMGRYSDEAVIETLTQVRGIGQWTAEMFLMSALARPDIWPSGDLGVRAGWSIIVGAKQPLNAREVAEDAHHLSPYRSSLAWYCWQVADEGKNR